MTLDDLRVMAALAHTAPDVTVALATETGRELIVAHRRLDAALDPCQLRTLVASARRGYSSRLLDRIVGARIVTGVGDLGGGVFRRLHGGVEQRWVPTVVPHETVLAALETCPIDLPEDALHVRVAVDSELGATTLCLTAAHGLWSWRLDELAVWAHSACLVAELTTERVEWPAA